INNTITKGLRTLDTVSTTLLHLFFSYLLEMNKAIAFIKDEDQYKAVLQQERKLGELGIKRLVLTLKHECLHRVFKNKFDLCGRFYGAWHMNMPSNLRKYIRINGNETTQLDYSGLHIRMLYHEIGEDYKDDPYMIGTKEERGMYKLVSLISINCDAKGACGAIRQSFEKEGIVYNRNKKKPIKRLVDAFIAYHKLISEKIFTAQGDRLQNLDSMIMDGILTTLTKKGIVALPVHDEIIVETQHKELAKQVMTDEYKKIMKFEPIIDEK
ncbi:hypothetical protein QUF70_21025, partial [Desulfobacterales bacterium HSG17]|nr:hypothetical protein [Desulfobacterales bacterium HSG17]